VARQDDTAELGFDGVTIDRDAEVPIGVQLAWALRARIGDGRFSAGKQLPGLRELAEMTGVNVNTIRAVYQRLEQEGLIDSRQGSGTFVAIDPPRPSAIATIAADAARVAREIGVEPREVAAARSVSPGVPARPPGKAAERRRVLREQIATLERTLVEMEAKHPGVAPPPADADGVTGPALLGAEELERVQTMLVRRMAIVQAAIDRLGSEEIVPDGGPQARPSAKRSAARAITRPAPAGA
jgi:DNA-binding transcriptional regulator YhcF (GntR family)